MTIRLRLTPKNADYLPITIDVLVNGAGAASTKSACFGVLGGMSEKSTDK